MTKRTVILSLLAALLLLPFTAVHTYAIQSSANAPVIKGGKLVNNRVLIPVRAVSEHMGAEVLWNKQNQRITIIKGQTTIILTVGSTKVHVNQEEVRIDVPAELQGGTTYVPLRFVSQTLGAEIDWNQLGYQATINFDEDQILIVSVTKPVVQVAHKLTTADLKTLIDKLNEATEVSKVKDIRTYFSPYFTDQFINSIVQHKGLDNNTKVIYVNFAFSGEKPNYSIYPGNVIYVNSTTATYTQTTEIDQNSIYTKNHKVLTRKMTLTYKNNVWKVNNLAFSESELVTNP